MRESLERPGSAARVRRWLLAGLVAGNLWQIADEAAFFQGPIRDKGQSLPFTWSPDYSVSASATEIARSLKADVERGRRVLLTYNFSASEENTTDPAALLERLYLGLGHERFVGSVYVFGSSHCRYDCLPIRPLEELGEFLEAVANGRGRPRPEDLQVYAVGYSDESATMLGEIGRHFRLVPGEPSVSGLRRFKLSPRVDASRP